MSGKELFCTCPHIDIIFTNKDNLEKCMLVFDKYEGQGIFCKSFLEKKKKKKKRKIFKLIKYSLSVIFNKTYIKERMLHKHIIYADNCRETWSCMLSDM